MKKISSFIRIALCYFLIFGQAIVHAQSTAAILPQGKTQFLNNNADPLTSGTVDFYIPSTTTRKTTWQNSAKTIANANPVVLDAGGRAIIYGDGTYRQVVKDRSGNLIYDAVTASAGTGGGTTGTGDGDLVGTVKPWAGLVAPNQYAFAYGQEISRTTYSVLFTAITLTQTVTCTSGSPILTNLSDTSQIPFGADIETTCVPAGSRVIAKTTTTITLNNNASLTISTSAVIFPFNNGNGSTTFNLPDMRGYVVAGRTNMGGSTSSNLTSIYFAGFPNSIGQGSGSQSSTIATPNLPAYTPSGTVVAAGTISQITPAGTNTSSALTGGTTAAIQRFPTGAGAGANDFLTTAVTGSTTTYTVTGTAAAQTFSGTPVTPTFTNSGSTFNGTAQGGVATPFSNVQPTFTLNYIIKITPDSNSADASGVTSLGNMTGDIACGAGLLCTGNIISVVGGGLWASTGNDIYNTNIGKVQIANNNTAGSSWPFNEPISLQVLSGSSSSRISAINTPSVVISRYENVNNGGDGSNGAALNVVNSSTGSAGTPTQNVAIAGWSTQSGNADTVGVYGIGWHSGVGTVRGAFGGYFNARAIGDQSSAIAVEISADNFSSGADRPYNPIVNPSVSAITGIDITYSSPNHLLAGGAVLIRSASNLEQWDVGIGLMKGDFIKTASIQDDTNSGTLFLANSGSHVNGINLTGTGTTYSGNAIMSPSFYVNGNGRAGVGTGTNGGFYFSTTAFAINNGNFISLFDQVGSNAAFEMGNGTDPQNTYNNSTHRFRSRGATSTFATITSGGIGLFGTTSGTLTLKPPAIAGSNTITFPAGTTDFSATGGTNQVIKQTSSGGAFTVATISGSEITGAALTKIDDTNVTLTLGGSPTTALLNATSLTLGWIGQLGLIRGGTAASLTASNGGIVYSTASALAILSGTATANLPLLSGSSTTPSWATISYPTSATSGGISYFSSTTTMASSGLLAANQIVLGGGSATTPATLGSLGTTATVLHGNAAGAPSFSAVVSADMNITTTSCTNQFVTAISSGGVGTCTTDTLASAQHANQGTTTTVLHGNSSGNPSWASVALADLATQATNTVLGNATSGSATPTALSMTSCSTASSAVIWTTNAGFGCNTSITAAAVPASGLTGSTLAAGVTASSLTSVGTLAGLTISTSFTATGLVTNASLANMTDTTIKGRAVGAGTGAPTDLTAAQVAAIVGSVGGAVKNKVAGFTRDLTVAAGNVGYTGIGFTPTACAVFGTVQGATLANTTIGGFVDSTKTSVSMYSTSTFFNIAAGNFMTFADATVTNFQQASVASYDADGFTLTWVKTGSPTGTATFYVLCFR